MKPSILVIEDSEILREQLETLLATAGYGVRLTKSFSEGLIDYKRQASEVILLDVMCLPSEGTDGLQDFLRVDPEAAVLITVTNANLSVAMTCCENGALDYIRKPFQGSDVISKVAEIIQRKSMKSSESEPASAHASMSVMGQALRTFLPLIKRISSSTASVLIFGESGSG